MMTDSNFDLPEDGCDFGFAFNDSNFSDRVLHISEVTQDIDENSNLYHRFVARLFTHDTSSVVFGPDYTEQIRNQVLLRHILVLRAYVAESTSQTMVPRAELRARVDQTINRLTKLEAAVAALQDEDNSD
ncbi:hypothetical protein L1987_57155 [Smallanthus sonchifolius]|uniref:Uncharacterized protein n=1 Tax=Smallanthus sonchifolius TaxID=185202 RepID=A0ACB9DC90_9ASTR|nr:hypothetical protein L1987_57155 [Smallanthus sonchifolius]